METSRDSAAASDPFEEFIRGIYLELAGDADLSQWPKPVEHESAHGVIPFDTSKYTLCVPCRERYAEWSAPPDEWKRLQFDVASHAEDVAGLCRRRNRAGAMVIEPSEAAELNASGCLSASAEAVRIALGNQRLLKLADILNEADAKHKERGEPTYSQRRYRHSWCGTPGCALGHWAAAHRQRWIFQNTPLLPGCGVLESATLEFALNPHRLYEAVELFDSEGCGNAKTARHAAAYLREFVARRKAARAGAIASVT